MIQIIPLLTASENSSLEPAYVTGSSLFKILIHDVGGLVQTVHKAHGTLC